MKIATTNEAAMQEVRELICNAARCFDFDLDQHANAHGRTMTDDEHAWHYRQATMAEILRWKILDLSYEFTLHYASLRVPPRLFGRLAALRIMVVKLGEEFPASRMDADRLLGEANDRLNLLSVRMEAERAF